MLSTSSAITELCDQEGVNEEELMELSFDSVNPGICLYCGFTMNIEPDASDALCPNCAKSGVYSSTMLFVLSV